MKQPGRRPPGIRDKIRQYMRTLLMATLIAGISLSSARAAEAPPLAGRWLSVERSDGGIGALYEFRADGSFQFSPGAIVEMPYRLEGDQLILPSATKGGPEQKSTLEWSGKSRFRMTANGQSGNFYQRQGTQIDQGNPLVGEWLGSNQMDGRKIESRFIFDASGTCLLLVKFTVQQGSWSVNEGNLAARINGTTALEGKLEISGNFLTLYRSGGRVTKLKRY
jgi:hypothetical protein